jgi:large subunit ribosomal protein L9e
LSPSKDHEVCIRGRDGEARGDSDGFCTGKLTKNLNHLAVNFSHPKKDVIQIELHHGARKNVATLRTVRTLINNLIIGVTKGFKYKMRYVYAHFPINVNVEKNNETGLFEVEIRYV